jgi:type VI secretion system protein ImpE
MSAEELFRSGDLAAAIEAQLASVKKRPSDLDQRFFLVGLLAFAGEADRAETHLDFLVHSDHEYGRVAGLIGSNLSAEEERRRIHEGSHRPGLPPENPEPVTVRLDLLAALHSGDVGTAQALMEQCVAEPPLGGSLNDESFADLGNGDEVLGSVIELFAGGRCLWVPLCNIRRLEARPPRTILDLLWVEAELSEASGVDSMVHIPVRYAGSSNHADDAVRLGRVTEWDDSSGVAFRGIGQNTFHARNGSDDAPRDVPVLELRTLIIGTGE